VPRGTTWLDAVTVVAAAAALATLYGGVERLVGNAPAVARIRGTA
jgi:hypothetical protein